TITEGSRSTTSTSIYIDQIRDFSIETSVIHYSGVTNRYSGLLINKNAEGEIFFGITANGNFTFFEVKKGVLRDIIPYKLHADIKKGNNVWNKLRLEKRGTVFHLYINETKVATTASLRLPGLDMGFVISGVQSVGYDHLTVKYLDNKPLTPDQKSVSFEDFNTAETSFVVPDKTNTEHYSQNGAYTIANKTDQNRSSIVPLNLDGSRNFSVEASLTHVSGIKNQSYGITLGYADEMNYSYFKKLQLNVGLRGMFFKDIIMPRVVTDELTNITRSSYGNNGTATMVGLNVNANYPFSNKLRASLNLSANYGMVSGEVNGTLIKAKGLMKRAFGSITYKLSKTWQATGSVNYNGRNFTLQGSSNAFVTSSLSINKDFLANKLSISLAANNAFV
ncbi:MAG: hypothetical protein EOO43_22495, partial [Flavobacterium sp.]